MVLIAFTEAIENGNFIYQHDNAPVHTSRHLRHLNPLKSYANCRQYNSISELSNAANEALTSIEKKGYKI